MRPLETIFVVLTACVALCLLVGRWPRTSRLLETAALAAAFAHLTVEGALWQMIPAYVANGIACLIVWKQWEGLRRPQIVIASSTLLLSAVSVLFSFLLPMFRLPVPTGPYPVGTSIIYFKDLMRVEDSVPGRGSPRELMVQIWYPAQPSLNRLARYREPLETSPISSYQSLIATNSRLDAQVAMAGAPFHVILFNHAWRGRRTNGTFLTEDLASHGYVVVSIDHTYNASLVAFPDGSVVHGDAPYDIDAPEISTPDHVKAIWDKELLKWVADQRFVLDRLEAMNGSVGAPFFSRLNTNSAGAIGHSFGGAGATAECAEDPRVRSAVNMDGWLFGAIGKRGANQPLLSIRAYTEQLKASPGQNTGVGAVLEAADSAETEASLRRFGGYLLSIRGASHDDFTDQPMVSPLRSLSHRGALPARRIQDIVRTYTLAFFDKTLRGEDPMILHAHSRPDAAAWLDVWPGNENNIGASIRTEGQ